MSHISQEARERAAETKKTRTRLKLIHAADQEMNEKGMGTTVENIVEEAGVSVATFYSFYTSRNALCVDAFTELVVNVLAQTITPGQAVLDRATAIWNLCAQRSYLLRASLMERLEHPTQYSVYEQTGYPHLGLEFDLFALGNLPGVVRVELQEVHDFVDSIAFLLWQPLPPDTTPVGARLDTALHMAALEILDAAASGRAIYLDRVAFTVTGAYA